jgi:hypothetical protein
MPSGNADDGSEPAGPVWTSSLYPGLPTRGIGARATPARQAQARAAAPPPPSYAECRALAIAEGALEPATFSERIASNIASNDPGSVQWEDSPTAQARLEAKIRYYMDNPDRYREDLRGHGGGYAAHAIDSGRDGPGDSAIDPKLLKFFVWGVAILFVLGLLGFL